MPRYIQPVKVGNKRYYAVYSTITMSFLTKPYPSIKQLKRSHPDYANLRTVRSSLRGTPLSDGSFSVSMPVFRLSPKKGKSMTDFAV